MSESKWILGLLRLKFQLLKWPSVDLKYASFWLAYLRRDAAVREIDKQIIVAMKERKPTMAGSTYHAPQRKFASTYGNNFLFK
jgi:hypothetical protein